MAEPPSPRSNRSARRGGPRAAPGGGRGEPLRLAPGAKLSERYRLERVIGAGGMATVWRARDETLGRPVAVKVMSDALAADPAYVERFAREAQTAARISHPNLVQIYDYSAAAAQPYLVMEYVEGGTLAQRAAKRPLGAAEARRLACDLLSAIARVHDAGVLHRDIKPANVLLGADGRARLTDFGIARLEDSTRLTQPGHVIGTLRYLAPELIEGAPPSRRSDLYAVGVLLREIAPQHDPALQGIIERLTAVEAQRRPADAHEVLKLLAQPGATQPTLLAPTEPQPAPSTLQALTRPLAPAFRVHVARSRARAAAAGAALALALVVIALLLSAGGSPTHRRAHTRLPEASGERTAQTRARTSAGSGGSLQERLNQLAASVRAAGR